MDTLPRRRPSKPSRTARDAQPANKPRTTASRSIAAKISVNWTPTARRFVDVLGTGTSVTDGTAPPTRRAIGAATRRAVTRSLQTAPLLFPMPQAGREMDDGQQAPTLYAVDVLFLDDERIRELNSSYRNKNKPTDVLSFSLLESRADDASFDEESLTITAMPPFTEEGALALGDIVISVDTALRQAHERGHDLQTEIAFLAVHGTLHLLGYDHRTNAQRRQMWKRQEEILGEWFA